MILDAGFLTAAATRGPGPPFSGVEGGQVRSPPVVSREQGSRVMHRAVCQGPSVAKASLPPNVVHSQEGPRGVVTCRGGQTGPRREALLCARCCVWTARGPRHSGSGNGSPWLWAGGPGGKVGRGASGSERCHLQPSSFLRPGGEHPRHPRRPEPCLHGVPVSAAWPSSKMALLSPLASRSGCHMSLIRTGHPSTQINNLRTCGSCLQFPAGYLRKNFFCSHFCTQGWEEGPTGCQKLPPQINAQTLSPHAGAV